ncbi:hypothetical protein K493DRAFT_291307 [Basidiobolus meristosporus CBS 931.73]|uniref:Integral membrane protein n=1 Tax=Basidiobolus meristosporus CBS 931.73 TaxID=1314790 RepID=A0A1Y1XKM8_9FUNG|nr:hypothetical protein K493DRAFT_291307 [Basidiobolus meristosporus CBS 931.73]|eukprot:ORX86311.1 hypothetical protein K493DRAFT_291307 [Basidiobolus meristosporus CBS 931.73]
MRYSCTTQLDWVVPNCVGNGTHKHYHWDLTSLCVTDKDRYDNIHCTLDKLGHNVLIAPGIFLFPPSKVACYFITHSNRLPTSMSRLPSVPPGYVRPPWPSLYWPFGSDVNSRYLYYLHDVWIFTTFWTLLFAGIVHGVLGVWAFLAIRRTRWSFLIPLVFLVLGLLAAFCSGTVMGYVLAIVYNAGSFRMSTWVPCLWGMIHTLVCIMNSYSTVTSIL